ncbi:LAFE_0G02300g1_1 [Lachancea fermentati]|uniref:LAFE_0G02300g1_1 n=1 Tax=Lachancea fermentati TaxID=4955 RepID=A0A1G4MGW2_LACFM|nr:LAFE_0G02300g1_1 [Lachancea fermentati]
MQKDFEIGSLQYATHEYNASESVSKLGSGSNSQTVDELSGVKSEEMYSKTFDVPLTTKTESAGSIFTAGESRVEEVKRELKPRHVTMIALGGTIGTGLFISISEPLKDAGPVGALISYIFMGSIAYSVTQSLGEMATYIPVASSFTVLTQRILSPAFGAANGYLYCFSWCITYALELSIVGQIIQYWTKAVPLAAWIIIFWIPITFANLFPVRYYGEFQFWIAIIKVLAIVGFIIYSFCMVCGAGKTGPVGFRYWRNPGPWGNGIISKNISEGRFLGWVSSLINAAFTYQGTELVGVSAGESKNPQKTVPKAINKVFFRILLFYIMSLAFIGLLVPFNDPKLNSDTTFISHSPFVIAIENSGTKILPDIFNAVILATIISAANSNVYVGSRVLFGLSKSRLAPRIFCKVTKQGVPYVAVMTIALFGFLAYLDTSESAAQAFNWLLNITAIAGFFAWLFISLSHIRFMQVLKSRGMSRDSLPFKAKFMPWGAYYAAFFITLIIIIQGFTAFAPSFNVSDFFAAYVSVFLFFVIWAIFQCMYRCRLIYKMCDVDIESDTRSANDLEDEEEEEVPTTLWARFWAAVA